MTFTEPYLIAHLVHSSPAFDVAIKRPCSHCARYEAETGRIKDGTEPFVIDPECDSCDGDGFWWIVPSSDTCSGGHRAFPYWHMPLMKIAEEFWYVPEHGESLYPLAPPNWPDFHPESYTAFNKAQTIITNLAEVLGLILAPTKVRRR